MPTVLTVEEEEKELPIICIVGDSSTLRDNFLKEAQDQFKIILIASKKPESEIKNLYFISYSDATILSHLEESIDYALLFLEDPKIKGSLNPIFSKLANDNAKTVLLITASMLNDFYDVILDTKTHSHFYFALLGEIISTKEARNKESLSSLILLSFQKKEVKLTGNDLLPVYPISLHDAMLATKKMLFGKTKKDVVYYLFYTHPETVLAAIHILARLEPDLKVTFSDEEKLQKPPFGRKEIKELISQKLNMIEAPLNDTFEGFENSLSSFGGIGESEEKSTDKPQRRQLSIHPKIKQGGSFLFTSFLLGTSLFLFIHLLAFVGGAFFLRQAIQGLEREQYTTVAKNAKSASLFLEIIKPTVYIVSDFTRFVDRDNNVLKTFQLIERALSLSELTGTTITTMSKKELNEKDIETLVAQFSFLYQEGERIKLENNNKALGHLLKPEYSKLLSVSQTLPFVLGYNSERNYLLLLQNNGELRPTGGFIGSVGELRISKGEVEELKIQDVYEYDGQLKAHIEPPFIVRRYLQPHLYLRDSNFSLNFQESASMAAKIYNLETKRVPDGVIAINFEVLKQILAITGPISLPDYKTTITDKNVFDYLQSAIGKNFFPGSTQKKDILTALFNKLISTLEEKPQTWLSIAKLIPSLMEDKNILFSFQEKAIQKIFNANSYGGEIEDKRVRESKTMYDYLYINEANIGVDKANILVTRNVSYEALLGEENLRSVVKITLNNPKNNTDYKSYIQFVVPKGSKLSKILINGTEQKRVAAITDPAIYEARNFKVPSGLEVEEYTRQNNTYFAFVATAKSGQSSIITIEYENGARKSLTSRTSYSLLYIKQPGTMPYDLSSTFYYPENYTPEKTSASSFGKNFIKFDDVLTKDVEYNITLQRNNN